MLDSFLSPIYSDTFTFGTYLICTLTALALGAAVAGASSIGNRLSRSLGFSLMLLPAVVGTVIMLVNDSIGTGVAVAGAFSLVRFRSVPGTAREIAGIFVCMAVGLACGTGYVALAAVFTLIVCIVMIIDGKLLSRRPSEPLELRIVVPESLNYAHEFDDIFEKYTSKSTLVSARTSNMGSLYKLRYSVMLRDTDSEQAFMDELRVRNGNLEISLGIAPAESGALL